MNTHAIKLDIDKRRAVLEPIVIAQGDKNGTTIQATIYDAGTLVTTQGLTARFRMRLPDGRHFYEKTATWSYSTGTASVTIDETQAASVAGTTHECYFVLLNGSTVVHSTSRFAIRVLRDATDGIAATSYSDRLEDLLDELGDLPLPADTAPVMDGNAYKGSSTRYARQDHRHPTDTTRAPLASPALTGSPTAPTPAQSDDGTRIATTHWVRGMASTSSPAMDGSASYGSSAYYARADHRHPTDTTRAAASDLATHMSDSTAHVTDVERSVWDAKASTDTATNVTNGLMSASDKVKLDGIDSGANAYSLPPATDSSLGGVIPDGTTITVDPDGTIHGASTYELPTMSPTTKGGAILGRGLEVEDGVLSVSTEGDGAIRSVTAEGWATQDGTPSPSSPIPIQVARGRNLLDVVGSYAIASGAAGAKVIADDGSITAANTASDSRTSGYASSDFKFTVDAGTYTLSLIVDAATTASAQLFRLYDSSNNQILSAFGNLGSVGTYTTTLTFDAQTQLGIFTKLYTAKIRIQLESGSTASPYVPYGHVGLEVTHGGTTTTIPIPLPSKGFAASLPDGTHDTLTIDGAGHVEWELRSDERVFDGSEEAWNTSSATTGCYYRSVDSTPSTTSTVRSDNAMSDHFVITTETRNNMADGTFQFELAASGRFAYFRRTASATLADFKTWLAQNPVTILYPLATPTTEDMGYVTLPITVEGDVVSIPELEDVAVVRWADSVATEVARQWYRRTQAVESRVAALESAVAEIVAG